MFLLCLSKCKLFWTIVIIVVRYTFVKYISFSSSTFCSFFFLSRINADLPRSSFSANCSFRETLCYCKHLIIIIVIICYVLISKGIFFLILCCIWNVSNGSWKANYTIWFFSCFRLFFFFSFLKKKYSETKRFHPKEFSNRFLRIF